ncbi:NAD(P)/FAD-dependent oxidoreductase [Paenibacillus zanthoxyli]|uniref:NAD(P)/FAD-dependent oxidoreductase n=1 Tax=Paenibacillus zanthoxyli TaxID=369399 RepID=UPI0004715587|nr:NAD(P)/FAD-dependent oxidoreductase [Paenibacillus zanthoxyli]
MEKQIFDVAIIGGGPAGLNAALVLGRARKKVAVIDEGRPRNAVTREVHGFLTRDGISPSEFRRIAKEEIRTYPSVSFVTDTVLSIAGTDLQFQIETDQGQTFASKKVLFAVGMKDEPLDIPGLQEVYGKSAFVCPYCDGWELRDQPLVIITKGAELMHFAPLISGWTDRFTVCTNGPDELTDAEREEFRRHQVPLFDSPIRHIDSSDGIVQQVVLEDGTTVPCTGIFFKPELVTGSDLPRTIGCQITKWGAVVVDDFGKTNVPGVYSAGDAASRMHQAIAAASMGAFVAAVINNELNTEAWGRKG